MSPCTRDCVDRKVGCHNETCPHGWAEYEKQNALFREEVRRIKESKAPTVAIARQQRIKTLLIKRTGKNR